MLEKRPLRKLHATLLVGAPLIMTLLLTTSALAGSGEKVLYTFCTVGNCTDGYFPVANLIFDTAGNLYGTTSGGGDYGYGTVFQLVAGANGTWTEKVLHSFKLGGRDGLQPEAGLVFDASGSLYGTTVIGGAHDGGTVFKLTPQTNGNWKEEVLHNFKEEGKDGSGPLAGLIFDADGSLYGTTVGGGAHNVGTVFRLTPQTNGNWKEEVLLSFNPDGADGYYPYAGLIFDASGSLYGTTAGTLDGGCGEHQHHCGTVFKLMPGANGNWSETVLHTFTSGGDGNHPTAGLTFDAAGNLYGTTSQGGAYNVGTAFQLTPGSNGTWTETVLYSFCSASGCTDGGYPSGLVLDSAGNLYGTTRFGGAYQNADYCPSGCGTTFELKPGTSGTWTEKVLHSFTVYTKDGYLPVAGLTLDAEENLYGTTYYGGESEAPSCDGHGIGCGIVFEIRP